MPAYHSRLTSNECLGNMAVLPLKTQVRGPAPCLPPSNEEDIIDEALYYFKVGLNSIENKDKSCLIKSKKIKNVYQKTVLYMSFQDF